MRDSALSPHAAITNSTHHRNDNHDDNNNKDTLHDTQQQKHAADTKVFQFVNPDPVAAGALKKTAHFSDEAVDPALSGRRSHVSPTPSFKAGALPAHVTEAPYDFHADHQEQLALAAERREEEQAKRRAAKKKKSKNYAWPYILAAFNRRALLNIVWILIAYVGCFYNRVHVQVGSTVLIKEDVFTKDDYGTINSVSYGVQFMSKFLSGLITDYFKRPKATFLISALLATLCTIGMVFWASAPGIGLLYSAIKFLAAFGRVCLLKIVATWWPKEVMGSMGAMINVTSSLGEVTSRFAASLMLQDLAWRTVWMVLAAIAAVLTVPMLLFTQDLPPISFQALRPTLTQYNEMRLTGRPIPVHRRDDEEVVIEHDHVPQPGGTPSIKVVNDEQGALEEIMKAEPVQQETNFFRDVVLPLLRKPKFYVVLMLAFCSTGLRESLVSWIGFYFQHALGMTDKRAALWSPILHLAIMPSSFVGGYLLDKVSKRRRGLVPVVFLSFSLVAMISLFVFTKYYLPQKTEFDNLTFFYAIVLLLFACFSFSAPNSFLDGVYVVEMAGPDGAAFASGIVGAIGYSGASASSLLFKKMADTLDGWCEIILYLTGAAIISWIGVIIYWQLDLADIRRSERMSRANSRASSLARSRPSGSYPPPPASSSSPQHPQQLDLVVEVPGEHSMEMRRMSESEAKAKHVSPDALRGIIVHPEHDTTSNRPLV